MTDPLIVVEGTLRLPSLRPLADRPLAFGQEWLLAGSRPLLSKSEFSLYAARLFTEYVKAFALSDMRSPYRAASIWGVMTERLPNRMTEHKLEPAMPSPAASNASGGSGQAAPQDTIKLNVKPPVAVAGAQGSRFPAMAKTAIAVACAALVAWLMLGHDERTGDEPATAAKDTDTTRPSARKAPASAPVPKAAQSSSASAVPVAAVPAVAAERPASSADVVSAPQVVLEKPKPVNTRIARSGAVQKATLADPQNQHLTPRQKAKLKREAKRLAAAQKRAASRTAGAPQTHVRQATVESAYPLASRMAGHEADDRPARTAKPRIDAESLYPAPSQSARPSQKDWDSVPSSARTPSLEQSGVTTRYPAPARPSAASSQSVWDDAPSSSRATARNRVDASNLDTAPASAYPRASQAERYSAPSYASAPSARVDTDNSTLPAMRTAPGDSAYARTLRSSSRYVTPAAKANDSLDIKSLYDMLQHSATLDDNVNVPVRNGGKASAK
jgi:hypothetical protein